MPEIKNLENILSEFYSIRHIKEIENTKNNYRNFSGDENNTKEINKDFELCAIYSDFIRVYIVLLLSCRIENYLFRFGYLYNRLISSSQEKIAIKPDEFRDRLIRQNLELVLYDLVANTEQVSSFRNLFFKYTKDLDGRDDKKTFMAKLITDIVLKELKLKEKGNYKFKDLLGNSKFNNRFINRTWKMFFNVSEENIQKYIDFNALSRLSWFEIFTCLGIRALFTKCMRTWFHPISFKSQLTGKTGIQRYFDGLYTPQIDTDPNVLYFVKFCTLSVTGVSAINNFCTAVQEIEDIVEAEVKGLLYIPGYPTNDTLKMEIFWQDEKKFKLNVLYLEDYYQLFKLWEPSLVQEYILRKTTKI